MFTANTFATVKMSPLLSRGAAAAVHAPVTSDDPVCPAPVTVGVPPSGPIWCVAMFGSSDHSSHESAGPLNIASRHRSLASRVGTENRFWLAFAMTGRISGPIVISYGPPDPPLIVVMRARAFMYVRLVD